MNKRAGAACVGQRKAGRGLDCAGDRQAVKAWHKAKAARRAIAQIKTDRASGAGQIARQGDGVAPRACRNQHRSPCGQIARNLNGIRAIGQAQRHRSPRNQAAIHIHQHGGCATGLHQHLGTRDQAAAGNLQDLPCGLAGAQIDEKRARGRRDAARHRDAIRACSCADRNIAPCGH